MKVAVVATFGGPEVITIGDRATRSPEPNEALVIIEAASINPLDLKIGAGYMQEVFPVQLPYVPGTDFSGRVEAIGSQVANVRIGDRVVGRSTPESGGAFAQRITVPAADLCVLAPGMSFEQAAALPTAFGTAAQALFDVGGLKSGQRVLIHAGAGGVGSFAIQLARQADAHVIATASQPNLGLLQSLGAHEAIDYRAQDISHLRDIDLVLDTVGGITLAQSWAALRTGGRIATLVDFEIKSREQKQGEFVFFKSATPTLPRAMAMFGSGSLQTVIDSIYPLEETRAALEKVATGHSRGKVIVRIKP